MNMLTENLRCLHCNGNSFSHTGDYIECTSCGTTYDVYEGIPCFIRFQPSEAQSLIEILAMTGDPLTPPSQESYATWAKVLREYHEAEDKAAYKATLTGGIAQHVEHRYRQYQILMKITEDEGIELSGKRILNVGSGLGFDTSILQYLGAEVVSLEYSPLLASAAKPATPESYWLSASAHVIPFEDESFDITIAQAALHHVTDIPACISEMLRVLKVGGTFMSVSDSYRADRYDESFVTNHFNNDMAVLKGVNENIPRFCEFSESLEKHQDILDIRLLTSRVFGYPDPELNKRVDFNALMWWGMDDLEALSDSSGGISCLAHKREPMNIPTPTVEDELIRPNVLLTNTGDRAKAMAHLANGLPKEYVNAPFPGPSGNTKFQLLNGWRNRDEDEAGRSAFNRARWFVAREAEEQIGLHFSANPHPQTKGAQLQVLLNGVESARLTLDDKAEQHVDLSKVPVGETVCIEFVLDPQGTTLEGGLFQIAEMALMVNA